MRENIRKLSLRLSYTLLAVLPMIWCSNAKAYRVSETSAGAEIKWSQTRVSFLVNLSRGPAGSLKATQNAMQTWTGVNTSEFAFVFGGSTTSTAYGQNDGTNLMDFGTLGSTTTLAQTSRWYRPDSGKILDADIRFNADVLWNTNGAAEAFDVQNVLTHELGHTLSLEDLYNSNDDAKTMYGYAALGETKKRTLHKDDIAGIAYLYPPKPVIPAGPVIDELTPNDCKPASVMRIYGRGFGQPKQGSKVHIGSRKYGSKSSRIMLWRGKKIKIRISNYSCKWFKGRRYRAQKVRVEVDGESSNPRKVRVRRPRDCK